MRWHVSPGRVIYSSEIYLKCQPLICQVELWWCLWESVCRIEPVSLISRDKLLAKRDQHGSFYPSNLWHMNSDDLWEKEVKPALIHSPQDQLSSTHSSIFYKRKSNSAFDSMQIYRNPSLCYHLL